MASRPPANTRSTNTRDLLKSIKGGQKKPTILEQAQKDWERRKQEDNIDEELKQATKSKDSFLERQQFLQRADLKQFEQEREIREKTRSKMAHGGT